MRLSRRAAIEVGGAEDGCEGHAEGGSCNGGFIIMWAVAMQIEGRDEFSITEYQRYWREGERQTYRLQKEFRELWKEFETPNELARQVAKQINRNMSRRDAALLPSRVSVVAEAH